MAFQAEAFMAQTHFHPLDVVGGQLLLPRAHASEKARIPMGPAAWVRVLPCAVLTPRIGAAAPALLLTCWHQELIYLHHLRLSLDGRAWLLRPDTAHIAVRLDTSPSSEHMGVLFGWNNLHLLEALHSAKTPVRLELKGVRGCVALDLPARERTRLLRVYDAFLRCGGDTALPQMGTDTIMDAPSQPVHDDPISSL